MCRDIERWEVNEVQIPGKKIEPQWLFLDTLVPKSIHAVTSQGFELKVALFVIASSLNGYLNL